MKKYFFNDGKGQRGPFTLDELLTKNINTDTPVWSEGMEEWKTADQFDELKEFFQKGNIGIESTSKVEVTPDVTNISNSEVAASITPKTESENIIQSLEISKPIIKEEKAATIVIEEKLTKVDAVSEHNEVVTIKKEPFAKQETMAASAVNTSIKKAVTAKSTAWISWVFGVLLLGGVGYYIYQDIEKNKDKNPTATEFGNTKTEPITSESANTTGETESKEAVIPETNNNIQLEEPEAKEITKDEPTPVITTTTKPSKNTKDITKPEDLEKIKTVPKAKSATDTKKKQEVASTTILSKEREMRNNWMKYVTFGNIVYNPKEDGLDEFNVPVYNGTNAALDKVTIRVDYLRREGKVIKSETIVINNVPPGSGINGKAPAVKRAKKVNTYFTGIYSKKLHFCFPQNNGNATDPYFCN